MKTARPPSRRKTSATAVARRPPSGRTITEDLARQRTSWPTRLHLPRRRLDRPPCPIRERTFRPAPTPGEPCETAPATTPPPRWGHTTRRRLWVFPTPTRDPE